MKLNGRPGARRTRDAGQYSGAPRMRMPAVSHSSAAEASQQAAIGYAGRRGAAPGRWLLPRRRARHLPARRRGVMVTWPRQITGIMLSHDGTPLPGRH